MGDNFVESVKVSPSVVSGRESRVQPGDLSRMAPAGNGVYGYQKPTVSNLLELAPQQDPCGGVLYFDSQPRAEDVSAVLRLWDVRCVTDKDYAVFVGDSETPGKDGYLRQVRLVSKFALRFMFGVIGESKYDSFPEQELSVEEVIQRFIVTEQERWGTHFGDPRLAGLFGGDGNYAQEALCFGLMLENHHHSVLRIWSRAWLVTK